MRLRMDARAYTDRHIDFVRPALCVRVCVHKTRTALQPGEWTAGRVCPRVRMSARLLARGAHTRKSTRACTRTARTQAHEHDTSACVHAQACTHALAHLRTHAHPPACASARTHARTHAGQQE